MGNDKLYPETIADLIATWRADARDSDDAAAYFADDGRYRTALTAAVEARVLRDCAQQLEAVARACEERNDG